MNIKPWNDAGRALHRERITNATLAATLRREEEAGHRVRWENDKLWERVEQLQEQVQHLLRREEEQKEQVRNMSQRLVQCKWQLGQLTLKR